MREIEALRKIARLAGMVVLETPKRSSYGRMAKVRRSLVAEIEVALQEAGYDMVAARKIMKAAGARPASVPNSEGQPMPWCDQCQCFHHETAEHIINWIKF